MSGILCAIRGGPSSQPTILKSIELAQDTKKSIFFLYVVNLDFLTHTSSSKTNHISKEIEEMGEFILLSAQEQAESAGVIAEGFIRDGKVIDEIINFCQEKQPSYVILGRPQEDTEDNLLSLERLQSIADRILEVCQAEVIFTPQPQTENAEDPPKET
jgi:nucleotide-binding universal stress UspA family protein